MRKFLPSLAVFSAIALLGFFVINTLKIDDVSISSQDCLKSQDVNLKGKLIITVPSQSLVKNLKQQFPCISDIEINKIYPSKIDIKVQTNAPIAKITQKDLYITSQGQIVSGSPSVDLPQINLSQSIDASEGNTISDQSILFALATLDLIAKSDFHPATVRILDSTDLAIYDSAQTVAVFSSKKSPKIQVDSLQQVLSAAKIDGAKLAKIDLRFDKPVITFK